MTSGAVHSVKSFVIKVKTPTATLIDKVLFIYTWQTSTQYNAILFPELDMF